MYVCYYLLEQWKPMIDDCCERICNLYGGLRGARCVVRGKYLLQIAGEIRSSHNAGMDFIPKKQNDEVDCWKVILFECNVAQNSLQPRYFQAVQD